MCSMVKVIKSFTCKGCLNNVTSAGRTSVDIGTSANLELVDMFYYLDDMLTAECRETPMHPWRQKSDLDGINSGSWYLCLPIRIYH